MKIALFASAFHPHLGGVEELCRQLAIEYRSRGLGVLVLTNRWPRSLPGEDNVDGIEVVRLPFRYPNGSLRSLVTYAATHRLIRNQLQTVLRNHRIDLMHVQCINASTDYVLAAHRQMRLPLVVTTQGERTMDASSLFQRSARMNAVFESALSSADLFTACSHSAMQDVQSHFGFASTKRSKVIYNGVRLSDFGAPRALLPGRLPFVLAIGRLVHQKGFDVLLHAWSQAHIESHDLVLAGEGPERLALSRLARELKIDQNVRFFGPANRAAAVELFTTCSLFVLPSRREPLGIVNLEAMAAGKAVIASRTGGVPELVEDGETGLLVPPENVDALASSISLLLNDPGRCSQMGTSGRARASAFDWSCIADQYLSIYQGLLTDRFSTQPRH